MICPACGAENPAGARFCNACGSPLPAEAVREVRRLARVKGSTVFESRAEEILDKLAG
jgi:predicted amidophosphoribosyltransferase